MRNIHGLVIFVCTIQLNWFEQRQSTDRILTISDFAWTVYHEMSITTHYNDEIATLVTRYRLNCIPIRKLRKLRINILLEFTICSSYSCSIRKSYETIFFHSQWLVRLFTWDLRFKTMQVDSVSHLRSDMKY